MTKVNFQLSGAQDLLILSIAGDQPLTFPEVDAIFKNISTQLAGVNNEQATSVPNVGTRNTDGDSDNAAGS